MSQVFTYEWIPICNVKEQEIKGNVITPPEESVEEDYIIPTLEKVPGFFMESGGILFSISV